MSCPLISGHQWETSWKCFALGRLLRKIMEVGGFSFTPAHHSLACRIASEIRRMPAGLLSSHPLNRTESTTVQPIWVLEHGRCLPVTIPKPFPPPWTVPSLHPSSITCTSAGTSPQGQASCSVWSHQPPQYSGHEIAIACSSVPTRLRALCSGTSPA